MKRLIFLLIPSLLLAQTRNGDFQIWLGDQVRQPVVAGLSFLGEIHHRFDEDASRFFYWHMQGWGTYRYKDIGVALGYRQTYTVSTKPEWNSRYGPMLDITLCKTWRKMELNYRFRLHHIADVEGRTAHFVYRDRFWMSRSIAKNIDIVVEEEVFYEETVGYNQNRVTLGLVFHPTKTISIRPFYRLRYTKSLSWHYQNIFGFYTAFDF